MKRFDRRIVGAFAAPIILAACVQTPAAPTVPVAPGPNKSFEAFAADQAVCQQYAAAQTAPAAAQANNQAVGGALLSTALGAGLGGAIGGGRGAGIGAASGAALGTVVGAGGSSYAQMSIQQQYDIMYSQCMAAHGNSVPGFAPPSGTPRYRPGPPPTGGPGPGPNYPGAPPAGPGPGSYYPGAPVPPPRGY
jgi:outer membrane lipoprotein SlyB